MSLSALRHCCEHRCLTQHALRSLDHLTLGSASQDTKRTGWMRKGIKGPESIADHMYRMSMMGMVCGADPETQVRCSHTTGSLRDPSYSPGCRGEVVRGTRDLLPTLVFDGPADV